MARTAFSQDILIAAPPQKVRSFFARMENLPLIHPLILNVQYVKTTRTEDQVPIQHYRVRDRMRLGPLLLTFTYRVQMLENAEGDLVFETFQSPRIYLFNTTRFLPHPSGTRVTEQVDIDAPRLLLQVVRDQGKQAHWQMLANMKRVLETGNGTEQKSAE